MPKYKVLQQSFINNRIHEVGDLVDYEGTPSGNLELIEDLPKEDLKKLAENAGKADAESGERLKRAASAGTLEKAEPFKVKEKA